MQAKTDQNINPCPNTPHYLWKGANFITVAAITSTSIVAVQSPIKTMLVNLTRNGTMIPASTGGIWGIAKALYAGTSASLGSSAVRTAYVSGVKTAKPIEESVIRDEALTKDRKGKYKASDFGYVMSTALGEILLTNTQDSLSTLRKVPGLLPADFKWTTPHNQYKLLTGAFAPRATSSIIYSASLLVLEEEMSKNLPIQDKNLSHLTSGALSGASAAFWTYPLSLLKDHVQIQSTVKEGKLYNISTSTATKELFNSLKKQSITLYEVFRYYGCKTTSHANGAEWSHICNILQFDCSFGQRTIKRSYSEEIST